MAYLNDPKDLEKVKGQRIVDVDWQDALTCADLVMEDGTKVVLHYCSEEFPQDEKGEVEEHDKSCIPSITQETVDKIFPVNLDGKVSCFTECPYASADGCELGVALRIDDMGIRCLLGYVINYNRVEKSLNDVQGFLRGRRDTGKKTVKIADVEKFLGVHTNSVES